MATEPQQLHVVLFPDMIQSHIIPMLDIARLFAARNVTATIIATPISAPTFTRVIEKGRDRFIDIELFRLPEKEADLPGEGAEKAEGALRKGGMWLSLEAAGMLQEQLEQYLDKARPNCLVADMFFPWATDSAAKFNIPRLVFHGFGYFALCARAMVELYEPYKTVLTDDDPFIIPHIPHEVKMVRSQFAKAEISNDKNAYTGLKDQIIESELQSFGVLVNSFSELEPEYADLFAKKLGRRSWHIGPVSLCNRSVDDKANRGKQASIDKHECMEWLNSKKQSSVIYISFGSGARSLDPQLHNIAMALEGSGHNFIWVVRRVDNDDNVEWLPQGFEQRMEGKGLIIKDWAPQVLILEHQAIGAFVTHCGWNSTLEAISAGVPMVTWPLFAEQFYNEKLVTQILKIGVPVGAKIWAKMPLVEDVIKQDAIEKSLREIMLGDEAEKRRHRARQLKEMARKAVEESGSSYSDLSALIDELKAHHK